MIGKKMRRMPFAIIGNTWLQFPKISVMLGRRREPGGRPHNTLPAGMETYQKNKGGRFL